MSKVYTAKEMRETAENITRVDIMDGLSCREHCYQMKQMVRAMFRQAADMIECEKKREKKYEYALKSASGRVSYTRFPDVLTVHSRALHDDTIVHHRVGEWEEVAE